MNWSEIFFGKPIERRLVKKKAHAFTVLSVAWSIFSLSAFVACRVSRDASSWIAASLVWLAHIVFVGSAAWFWIREKKNTEIIIYEALD